MEMAPREALAFEVIIQMQLRVPKFCYSLLSFSSIIENVQYCAVAKWSERMVVVCHRWLSALLEQCYRTRARHSNERGEQRTGTLRQSILHRVRWTATVNATAVVVVYAASGTRMKIREAVAMAVHTECHNLCCKCSASSCGPFSFTVNDSNINNVHHQSLCTAN